MRRPGHLLVGLYAWITAVALGATLVALVASSPASGPVTREDEVADFLLVITGLTILGGIAAVATSWGSRPARSLLVASLAVVLLGLLAPALSGLVQDAESALGFRIGPWIRLGFGGLASMLAFAGLWASWRTA